MENIKKKVDVRLKQFKGAIYEQFICEHLKKTYKECWLWKDVPYTELFKAKLITGRKIFNLKYNNKYHKNVHDFGIDIIIKEEDKYIFVQCKNYCEDSYVSFEKLKTYISIMQNHKDKKGMLFYTCKITCNLENNLNKLNIECINKKFNNLIDIQLKLNNYEDEQYDNLYTEQKEENKKIIENINKLNNFIIANNKIPEFYTDDPENNNLYDFIRMQEKKCTDKNYIHYDKWIKLKNKYNELF